VKSEEQRHRTAIWLSPCDAQFSALLFSFFASALLRARPLPAPEAAGHAFVFRF